MLLYAVPLWNTYKQLYADINYGEIHIIYNLNAYWGKMDPSSVSKILDVQDCKCFGNAEDTQKRS